MNRLLNNPDQVVKEMLEGYIANHSDYFTRLKDTQVLIKKTMQDRVSVVIGAGSGNEPWPIGYVGEGLADACALGNVFAAPAARSILNAIRAVPHEKGVICVATNHAGDVLNFELVGELAELEGIKTKRVYVSDDVTSAPKDQRSERRGIAGVTLVVKIVAAAAEAGLSLDEVAEIAELVNTNTYTASVTTSPAYILETGKQAYDLPDGMIEYGMGFNGEMGVERTVMSSADNIMNHVFSMVADDMELKAGEQIAVFLNPFKATTTIESFILLRRCIQLIREHGANVYDSYVSSLFPTQGAGGFSLTLLRMDSRFTKYYNAPMWSPLLQKEEVRNDRSAK